MLDILKKTIFGSMFSLGISEYTVWWANIELSVCCSQIQGHVQQMGLNLSSCGDDMVQFRRCLTAAFFLNAAMRQPDGSFRYCSDFLFLIYFNPITRSLLPFPLLRSLTIAATWVVFWFNSHHMNTDVSRMFCSSSSIHLKVVHVAQSSIFFDW
jgi:hypothetical protein